MLYEVITPFLFLLIDGITSKEWTLMKKQLLVLIALVSCVFLCTSCGGGGGSTPTSNDIPPQVTLDSLSVTPQSPSLIAGETTQLEVVAHYSDGTVQTPSSPQWSSSDIQCATVNRNNFV